MSLRVTLPVLALLGACAPADKVDALEKRVAGLEEEVKTLKSAPARPGAQAAANVDPAAEAAADELLKEIAGLAKEGKYDDAKQRLEKLKTDYGTTQTYKKARRLEQELAIIGKPAPATWDIEKWYQGKDQVKLDGSGTTLVVFWEEWCPHCRREVPELVKTYDALKGQGLQVVGLTKITKSSTEEKVQAFISEQKINYPIAKETGALSEHFGVSGIPAAAVVKDGKIVWRGHPASLSQDQLKSWL